MHPQVTQVFWRKQNKATKLPENKHSTSKPKNFYVSSFFIIKTGQFNSVLFSSNNFFFTGISRHLLTSNLDNSEEKEKNSMTWQICYQLTFCKKLHETFNSPFDSYSSFNSLNSRRALFLLYLQISRITWNYAHQGGAKWKEMHKTQLDNYQSADKTEAPWLSIYFQQFFMYEKTPSLTGSATWFYVLELSVHTSSEKWNQNWILKLYFPLEMEF